MLINTLLRWWDKNGVGYDKCIVLPESVEQSWVDRINRERESFQKRSKERDMALITVCKERDKYQVSAHEFAKRVQELELTNAKMLVAMSEAYDTNGG